MLAEKQIQDILIKNIEILEDSLTILSKEEYIPHQLGTRGFIDIYAKDSRGKHVLIEIKRSKAASREAIHEIYKYVEGVKNCLNARDDEIRVILASTEWKELIVPFSRFVHDSSIDAIGYLLSISNDKNINSDVVDILDFSQGRMIAPWHEIYWYNNKEEEALIIKEIKKRFTKGSIKDFILLIMNVPDTYNNLENAAVANTIKEYLGTTNFSPPLVPEYQYVIYVVHQLQPKEFYLKKVESCANKLELNYEDIKDDSIDETYDRFCDALWDGSFCGYFTIGNAQKFSDCLNIHGFKVEEVIRFGSFEKNKLLTNSGLIHEIEESITSLPKFQKHFNLNSASELSDLKSRIDRCLHNNQPWKAQINTIIDEQINHADSIELSIYNPATALLGIYLFIINELSSEYLPSFTIKTLKGSIESFYVGTLEFVNQPKSLRYILNKYYNGKLSNLTMLMAGDFTDDRHVEILFDLGLRYKTYKVQRNNNLLRLDDGIWCETDFNTPYQSIVKFIESNESLLKQIINKVRLHHKGSLLTPNLNPIGELKKHFDLNTTQKEEAYLDINAKCDFCDCLLQEELYMLDSKVKGSSTWAYFCIDCFSEYGEGLANAGLFKRNNGKWFQLDRKDK